MFQGDVVHRRNQVKPAIGVFLLKKTLVARTVLRRCVALGVHPLHMQDGPLGRRAVPGLQAVQDVVFPAVPVVVGEQHQDMGRFPVRRFGLGALCPTGQSGEQQEPHDATERQHSSCGSWQQPQAERCLWFGFTQASLPRKMPLRLWWWMRVGSCFFAILHRKVQKAPRMPHGPADQAADSLCNRLLALFTADNP